MITIGIVSNKKDSNLGKILFNYIKKRGKVVEYIEQIDNTKITKKSKKYDLVLVEMLLEEIEQGVYNDHKFNIIIETSLYENEESLIGLQKIIFNIKDNGYFIFNSDYLNKISFRCNNLYPITYGLNGKSSVTASSVNDLETLEFSLCLQRSILTIEGNVIEPFEKPTMVNGKSTELNDYLAALTCMIVLGYKF